MINVRNQSHAVTAQVVIPEKGINGVILNQGGYTGGWSHYTKDNRLSYAYSFCGFEITHITADQPLPAGTHQVRVEFGYDGGGLGKGANIILLVDGSSVASGRVERTHPLSFSLDETTDMGVDSGAPVTNDYGIGRANAFTGQIDWVEIDAGEDIPTTSLIRSTSTRWR